MIGSSVKNMYHRTNIAPAKSRIRLIDKQCHNVILVNIIHCLPPSYIATCQTGKVRPEFYYPTKSD